MVVHGGVRADLLAVHQGDELGLWGFDPFAVVFKGRPTCWVGSKGNPKERNEK